MPDETLQNEIRSLRQRAGLSQQDLARQALISRQALGALEAGRAVPSTVVALRLARALACRVENLFRLDDDPAPLRAEWVGPAPPANQAGRPQRVVLGALRDRWVAHPLSANRPAALHTAADALVPADEASRAPGVVRVQPLRPVEDLRDNVILAGCAPALGLLAQRMGERACGVRLAWIHAPSQHALDLMGDGQVHIAGSHLFDEASGDFNVPFVRKRFPDERMCVVNFARWEQGLLVAPGNPLGLEGVEDLVRPGLRFINREPGAGARKLVERLLAQLGVPEERWPQGPVARGHMEVAQAVAYGAADTGIAVRGAALAHGLDFVPLAEERFDLVFPDAWSQDRRVQRILDTLDSGPFRRELAALGGYETDLTGRVVGQERAS